MSAGIDALFSILLFAALVLWLRRWLPERSEYPDAEGPFEEPCEKS